MNKFIFRFCGAAVAGLAAVAMATSASALVNGNIVITVDENGNGALNGFGPVSALPFYLGADPGPGGLPSVLTYDMLNPPGLVSGDVLMQEGPGGPIFDVVRFNATEVNPSGSVGSLLFYSDNTDGFDSLADTPSPPGALYANTVTIAELGPEGNNGSIYIPTAGEPGFVAGASAQVEYILISDGSAVPEPAAWTMMLLGVGAIGTLMRRRRVPATAA
jgi:hypothetical protein